MISTLNINEFFDKEDKTSILYNGDIVKIQIYSNTEQALKDAVENKMGIVDFSDCENILKEHNIINKNDKLYSINVNIIKDRNNSLVEKLFKFNTKLSYILINGEGNIIDSSLCKKVNIKLSIDKQTPNLDKYFDYKSKFGIDIYNKTDEYFNNICFPFQDTNYTDQTINSRRKKFNYTISCSDNCQYRGLDTNFYSNCECNAYFNINDIHSQESKPPENRFNFLVNNVFDSVISSNINLIFCYESGFKNIKKQLGFYIYLVLLITWILSIFIYNRVFEIKVLIKNYDLIIKNDKINIIQTISTKSNVVPVEIGAKDEQTKIKSSEILRIDNEFLTKNNNKNTILNSIYINEKNDKEFNNNKPSISRFRRNHVNTLCNVNDKININKNIKQKDIIINENNEQGVSTINNFNLLSNDIITTEENKALNNNKLSIDSYNYTNYDNICETKPKASTNNYIQNNNQHYLKNNFDIIRPYINISDISTKSYYINIPENNEKSSSRLSPKLKDIIYNQQSTDNYLTNAYIDSLSIDKQIEIDNRGYFSYLWYYIKKNHGFVNVFVYKSISKPFFIIITNFIIDISDTMLLNALFFNDLMIEEQSIYKKANEGNEVTFWYLLSKEFFRLLWPAIISVIIVRLIDLLIIIPKLAHICLDQFLEVNNKSKIKQAVYVK